MVWQFSAHFQPIFYLAEQGKGKPRAGGTQLLSGRGYCSIVSFSQRRRCDPSSLGAPSDHERSVGSVGLPERLADPSVVLAQAMACRQLAKYAELMRGQLEEMAQHFEDLVRESAQTIRPNPGKAVIGVPTAPAAEPLTRSIKETAQLLSIGRSTIYRLIGEGALETVKIGHRTLIKSASIRALGALQD